MPLELFDGIAKLQDVIESGNKPFLPTKTNDIFFSIFIDMPKAKPVG